MGNVTPLDTVSEPCGRVSSRRKAKRRVPVRRDGAPMNGQGHLIRGLALAHAVRDTHARPGVVDTLEPVHFGLATLRDGRGAFSGRFAFSAFGLDETCRMREQAVAPPIVRPRPRVTRSEAN